MVIARIQYLRGPKSHSLKNAPIQCQLIICSEFNSPILGICKICVFRAIYTNCDSSITIETPVKIKSIVNDVVRVEIMAPFDVGTFDLTVSAQLTNDQEDIILTNTKQGITVVGPEDWSHRNSNCFPLLPTVRELAYFGSLFRIKENYGETLGSHIYDCSIVMLRYLSTVLYNDAVERSELFGLRRGLVVELGAGCGGVGISLSTLFSRIILTDKQELLHQLQDNINLNNCNEVCSCCKLDWTSEPDMIALKHKLNDCPIDLLLAGDVFYDETAFDACVKTIEFLADPVNTVIIASQRCREKNGEAKLDVISKYTHLAFECLHREAGVIIWRITLPSSNPC